MSSGMSRISFKTIPQFSRRSVSFLLSAAESGNPMASTRTEDIIRFNINSPRLSLGDSKIPRLLGATRGFPTSLRRSVLHTWRQAKRLCCFDYTFPELILPAEVKGEGRLCIGGGVRVRHVGQRGFDWRGVRPIEASDCCGFES